MNQISMMIAIIFLKNQQILKLILLFILKKTAYKIYFSCINKHEAKKLIKKFDLIDKTGSINYNNNNNNNNNNNENEK